MKKIRDYFQQISRLNTITLFISMVTAFLVLVFGYAYASGSGKQDLVVRAPRWVTQGAVAIRDGFKDLRFIPLAFKEQELPRYNIVIAPKDIQTLAESIPDLEERRADVGYVEGIDDRLRDENRVFVPATFEYGDQTYDIDVRYRGNGPPHWTFPKKSLRVRFPDDKLLEGKKDVNFIIPVDRRYLVEEINYYRARKMGFMVPDSRFVVVTVNGKDPAVYWEVEHFGQEFLERHGISGDVNLYGEGDTFQQQLYTDANYWQKYNENPADHSRQVTELDGLLRLLNEGSDEEFYARVFDYIDKENFYAWTIHNLLSMSWHQDYSHNIRMYFDTTVGKFTIIPWDVYLYSWKEILEKDDLALEATANPLVDRILSHPKFMQERNERLWQYLKDTKTLDNELAAYDALFDSIHVAIFQDPLERFSYSSFVSEVAKARGEIENNFLHLRQLYLNPKASFILSNRIEDTRFDLEVANFQSAAPVFLDAVKFEFKDGVVPVGFVLLKDGEILCETTDETLKGQTVTATCKKQDLEPRLIQFAKTPNVVNHYEFTIFRLRKNTHQFVLIPKSPLAMNAIAEVKLTVKNSFTEEKVKDIEGAFVDKTEFRNLEDISVEPAVFVARHGEFRLQRDRTVLLERGIYTFSDHLVVPKNTQLTIAPGTTIHLVNGASFVSYSPVIARGTQDGRITIRGEADGKGENFVVLDNEGISIFEYTHFIGGGESTVNGAFFSGMLAIHHAESIIRYSTFENAQGDDALNIKYASSTIAYNMFVNNKADGIDYDFSDGVIEHNRFVNNGDDGIDTSGSPVTIQYNRIEGSLDKCISVGERSTIVVFNNVLRECHIGIEIKDSSTPIIINNVIVGNDIGINAYQKKPIFGGGHGKVFNSIIWGNTEGITMDSLSTVDIQQSAIEGSYKGEGNFSGSEPVFQDPGKGDFTNRQKIDSMEYSTGGDPGVLKEYLGIEIDKVPVGLMRNL